MTNIFFYKFIGFWQQSINIPICFTLLQNDFFGKGKIKFLWMKRLHHSLCYKISSFSNLISVNQQQVMADDHDEKNSIYYLVSPQTSPSAPIKNSRNRKYQTNLSKERTLMMIKCVRKTIFRWLIVYPISHLLKT